jgi:uncharacterized protein (DUF1501 family)
MDIWHTARPEDERNLSGWLGRYFDACCTGSDPKAVSDASVSGLSIGETQPLAMRGEKVMPVSFESPERFQYRGKDRESFVKLSDDPKHSSSASESRASSASEPGVALGRGRARTTRGAVEHATASDQLSFLSRTALDAVATSDRIISATERFNSGNDYPRGEFGSGLRAIAAMIAGELPTRVYYVTLGGFDTHANQSGRHDQLMSQFSQGVAAFWNDMKAQKNDQRVMVMTFSEFGRRVAQNASQGTDHGAAAPMFLIGSRLREGVIGKHPSLTDLDAGDLKFGIDFRSVYASLLENWLDVPSKPILGKQFPVTKLVKG